MLVMPLAEAQPTIKSNGIVNASGYQTKLADTIFVVFGDALGSPSTAIASALNYSTSLAGTSIKFTPTAGGEAVNAKMVRSCRAGGRIVRGRNFLMSSSRSAGVKPLRVRAT